MMADSSGSVGMLGVIVGVAFVLLIGFFVLSGNISGTNSVDVNIKPPGRTL